MRMRTREDDRREGQIKLEERVEEQKKDGVEELRKEEKWVRGIERSSMKEAEDKREGDKDVNPGLEN